MIRKGGNWAETRKKRCHNRRNQTGAKMRDLWILFLYTLGGGRGVEKKREKGRSLNKEGIFQWGFCHLLRECVAQYTIGWWPHQSVRPRLPDPETARTTPVLEKQMIDAATRWRRAPWPASTQSLDALIRVYVTRALIPILPATCTNIQGIQQ